MKINKVRLSNYRNFKNVTFDLSDGTLFIIGKNGSGKSALFNAVSEMITFDTNVYRRNFHDMKDPYRIEMTVYDRGKEILLIKDAEESLFDLIWEDRTYHKDECFEMFQKITGIRLKRNMIKPLFFLGQRDWVYYFEKGKNIKTVSETIKKFISGGDVEKESDISLKVRDRKKKIESDIREYNERLEKSENELNTIRAYVIEKEINLNIVEELKKELDEITDEMEKKDFLYKVYSDYTNIKKEFSDLSEKSVDLRERIEKIHKLEEKVRYLENRIDDYKDFSLEKIEEISRISGILENKNREVLKDTYRNIVSNLLVYKNIFTAVGLSVFLLSVAGMYFSIYSSAGIILAGIMGILAVYFKARASEEQKKGQMEVATAHSREIQGLNNDLTRILKNAKVTDVDEYKEKFQSKEALAKNLEKNRSELEILYDNRSIEDIEEEYSTIRENSDKLKKRLSELKEKSSDGQIEMEIVKSELELLVSRNDLKVKKMRDIEKRIESNKYTLDELFSSEEKYEHYKRLLKELRKEENMVNFVIDYMHRAHMDLMENANNILDLTIDKYFSSLTDGTYKDVKLEFTCESGLRFSIFDSQSESYITQEYLSQGTRDQLYLSFRFAMIELLDDNNTIPLFMDDVFSFSDSDRWHSSLKMLEEMGRERQIVYLSSRKVTGSEIPGRSIRKLEDMI
ncbi:MAG: ATP-binding protein [Candidatus Muiribacteriaceae bacterium]